MAGNQDPVNQWESYHLIIQGLEFNKKNYLHFAPIHKALSQSQVHYLKIHARSKIPRANNRNYHLVNFTPNIVILKKVQGVDIKIEFMLAWSMERERHNVVSQTDQKWTNFANIITLAQVQMISDH